MQQNIRVESILFLDIETVPLVPEFSMLDETFQKLWEQKAKYIQADRTPEEVYERAGIYAEFGKIVCISFGMHYAEDGERKLKIRSFYGHDEKEILTHFCSLLQSFKYPVYLCAHNGKEFDFPYLSRRMLINGIALPAALDNAGKKPWEINHLDTLELWKFGDYKHYTSLSLLAAVFGIPTPKDDIDGSMVAKVYWHDKDVERIKVYCEKDVLTLAQVYLKLANNE